MSANDQPSLAKHLAPDLLGLCHYGPWAVMSTGVELNLRQLDKITSFKTISPDAVRKSGDSFNPAGAGRPRLLSKRGKGKRPCRKGKIDKCTSKCLRTGRSLIVLGHLDS
eukprot:2104820-Amphidinium_carterae.1